MEKSSKRVKAAAGAANEAWLTSSYVFLISALMLLNGVCIGFALTYRASSECSERDCRRVAMHARYNDVYPLSEPQTHSDRTVYRLGVISDLDTDSRHPNVSHTWMSYYKTGYLTISNDLSHADVTWDVPDRVLTSRLAEKGRGMELSDLVAFNGKLYSCDDRTGVVFEIPPSGDVRPWVVLQDGDGSVNKGFKCEWMAVKDDVMWVGGLGKEWTTTTGVKVNLNPQWVKSISHVGDVIHHDWIENYDALRRKGGFEEPGYLIHESGVWSDVHRKWLFLPRRASTETYDETADERRAANLMFMANENFTEISMTTVSQLNPTHGFSAFRFVPNTQDDVIVALKSMEDQGHIASFLTVFKMNGDVIMKETKIGDYKFEGVEFI